MMRRSLREYASRRGHCAGHAEEAGMAKRVTSLLRRRFTITGGLHVDEIAWVIDVLPSEMNKKQVARLRRQSILLLLRLHG